MVNTPREPDAGQKGKSRVSNNALAPACDECRIRKVRCNKEYPKCSSCRASNLPCGFSNKGKRINHTKKLVNDVELLGNRLGKIEEALLRCLSAVEANSPRYPTPAHNCDDGRESREDSRRGSSVSDESWSDGSTGPLSQASGDLVEIADSGSPLAMLYTEAQVAGEQLMASLADDTSKQSLRTQLTEAGDLFQELATGPPPVSEPQSDDLAPALPPRALLEGFVDAYFVELNPFLPIYGRQSVMAAIEQQYGSHSDAPDLAWIGSFNSILLHTLEAKSSAARPAGQMGDNSLERGLIVHLLLNARRCYNNFERLLQPRLANVQSLLSMALVALKYFSFTMFETVFAQACQLARTIGLNQTIADTPQETERRHLFWSLFLIDKLASLVAGKPCLLPSYGCATPLPVSDSGSLADDQFVARVSFSFIMEGMYRRLYSARGARRHREQLSRRAAAISRRLEDWASQHSQALCPSSPSAPHIIAATELQYGLCICRVLVHRRIAAPDSRSQRREHARAGLRLLQELCEGDQPGVRRAGYAVFNCVTLNYALVLFLELYLQVLQDPQPHQSDIALLTFFATRADALAAQTTATSYTARVREVSALCCQIVSRLQVQGSEPTTAPDTAMPDPFWDLGSLAAEGGWAESRLPATLPTHPDPGLFFDPSSAAQILSLGQGFPGESPVMLDGLLDSFGGDGLGLMQ
ncbi:hypothetical protein BO71DRAFT_404581 [Aspergillus ellipticus CBS 707.79]|uniref:Zn(2)-C6 fungal-type domain-containing protein n=1 Tax=Aspergillus ellipticus CBS 707.79 TaxID=1448320 RepID=A0A319CSS2_9EURO|nr:hypothetical protein BO71DRAFT_404581 [Aspergillus ellipticus CBS 707.79]